MELKENVTRKDDLDFNIEEEDMSLLGNCDYSNKTRSHGH